MWGNPLSFSDPTGEIVLAPAVYYGVLTLDTAGALWWAAQHPITIPTSPMESRSQGSGAEARPLDVNPGKDCDGNCLPCPPNPPNPPPFDHDGDAHGSDRGFHTHQWQYHQDPDCMCRARKASW